MWETVDLNTYADFYKSLDRKSQGELICLESTFRANNLNLPKKDKKSRSENERMLIWDMHFKRALVQLKLNKLSREIITQQYKVTIDIEPFLDEILSE